MSTEATYLPALRELDPAFEQAVRRFCAPPSRPALPPSFRELLAMAIQASTTQLHLPEVRRHLRNALALGASQDEVMEVLQLTSVLGIHTCTLAMPILLEELAVRDGGSGRAEELLQEPRRKRLKEAFIAGRGYWRDFWNDLLLLDPDFFEAFVAFSSVPWCNGPLPPKFKELVYVAIDCSTTHLFTLGLRLHVQNALQLGATAAELMEVLQLASAQGLNACSVGIPILQEELAAFGRPALSVTPTLETTP